jgi:adenylate cyclase
VLACAGIYLGTAAVLFSRSHLWLPLIVPLFVQAPLTLALGWRLKLLEFERLTDTLMHFMSRWLREKILRHEVVGAEPELRYGVCLHSDVQGYTGLSERLRTDPLRLKALEGEYWKLVDEQIEAHQGERLDISGDGMTCVWTAATPRSEIFGHACRAALEIQHAVDRFNAQHTDTPFHTRIGLHAGNVTLGLIGGKGHYSLAVGGDVANTAARLESDINKVLHTSVLISDAVRVAPEVCVTRRVGTFVPRGKSQAVAVCEMRDGSREPPVDIARFESALTAFEAGDWGSAQAQFEQLHRDFADDGPTAFYVKILARYATGERRPPAGRPPGVIDFNEPWLMRELEA